MIFLFDSSANVYVQTTTAGGDLPLAIFSFCCFSYLAICSSARPLVRTHPPTPTDVSNSLLGMPAIIVIINHIQVCR